MSPESGRIVRGMLVFAAVVSAGCGGESGGADGADTAAATPPVTPAPAPTPAVDVPDEPTPAMVARGDSIFHGLAANGICNTCHAQKGEGGAMAPNLTDDVWLHIDGSMKQIAGLITTGVPTPRQHPATMPPWGGVELTQADLAAVAGYVYSLSHDIDDDDDD